MLWNSNYPYLADKNLVDVGLAPVWRRDVEPICCGVSNALAYSRTQRSQKTRHHL